MMQLHRTNKKKIALRFYVASNLEVEAKKEITGERSEDKATHV